MSSRESSRTTFLESRAQLKHWLQVKKIVYSRGKEKDGECKQPEIL